MSGAEVMLVLELVSEAVGCFQAVHQIYTAANDFRGLTKSFEDTAERIPLVLQTLILVKQSVKADGIAVDTLKIVKPILERCKEYAATLQSSFDEALPRENASRLERYRKAAALKCKSGELKENMELVMSDLALLAQYRTFQDSQTLEDIRFAIEKLGHDYRPAIGSSNPNKPAFEPPTTVASC